MSMGLVDRSWWPLGLAGRRDGQAGFTAIAISAWA
jgi:hypothetical protein